MTMMMMANQAEPLDKSCTKTKYISWVWRNGLEGNETMVTRCNRRVKITCFILMGGGKHLQVCPKFTFWLCHFALDTSNSGLTHSWNLTLREFF